MQELRRDLEVVVEVWTLEQHQAAQKEEENSTTKRTLGLSGEAARKTAALSASITQLELLCISLPASLDVKTSPTPLMTAPWKRDDSAELEEVSRRLVALVLGLQLDASRACRVCSSCWFVDTRAG